ncbi:RNA recognition motif domain containing protein [Entamoeba histolytica HM-1:IMSS-B]|uniref:RNA recognition motif domain containing protein n=6 Tax=Entamoeba histolytica TaxID=5759 RepID=C4MA79_ENTH1|nr:RNA recognition motif domain containing protein [Entamoeba histolytica HM-1:IMSS]EMD48241.1 RNA recognition domain containing protein [Entamoeba histolytica KU27]EMH75532.1 RNA recognition motif domain containing protein [Entamoeba histolytica HM-1:IMSS-B]EMS11090.1 RNA recognition motif domain containing protein [Entamoeba histolytica HM-3:IMSS]ENY62855.1 RNA recognition motif domain containing protein [Entamoeba histolytica HM-1:IMSS-A]GAT98670.1 RNA recognition motif domain containing pr|eukprot:XP_652661.1 RNA recognition motif domain containing protein [Entamoeba histolytica HM-1:IMSS]
MEIEQHIPYFLIPYIKEREDIDKVVVIGNVTPKVTLDDLYSIFENFGIILDLKQIKTITHPILCGYYYILYEEKDSTETCKYIEKAELGDLPLSVFLMEKPEDIKKVEEIFKNEDNETTNSKNNFNSESKASTKLRKTICVRNIGNASDDKIQKYFEKCGNINLMEFNTGETTIRQVTIEFETEEAALRALQMDGSSFNDHPIRVVLSNKVIKSKNEHKPIVTKKESALVDDLLASLEKKTMMKIDNRNEKVKDYNSYYNERRKSRSRSRSRGRSNHNDTYRDRYSRSERDYYRDRGYEDKRRLRYDRYDRRNERDQRHSRDYYYYFLFNFFS